VPKHPFYLTGLPPTVTFTSGVPRHPLPHPRYLALHAAYPKVAHLSGASEYVDTIFRKTGFWPPMRSSGEALWYGLGKSHIAVA
jgi:hypothetical protein